MQKFLIMIFLLTITLFFYVNLFSQDFQVDECKIIKKYADGSVLVKINGKEMLAITEKMEKNMLKMRRDLLDAEKQILLKDSLMANYDNTVAQYERTISNMKAYINELESISKGYKQLASDYKRMKEPWVNVNLGIGATGSGNKPALLMGIDIRRILISGFVQERNSGIFLGTVFRLY